jgi:hypothetical protein
MICAYRVVTGAVPESKAREDMEAIWTPEGTWEACIADIPGSQ